MIDGGGTYTPSKNQDVMWGWWRKFWDEWVPQVTRGEPYGIVVNGDALDGRHHGSTTQISHNIVAWPSLCKLFNAHFGTSHSHRKLQYKFTKQEDDQQ